jgi:hypothetical protein
MNAASQGSSDALKSTVSAELQTTRDAMQALQLAQPAR